MLHQPWTGKVLDFQLLWQPTYRPPNGLFSGFSNVSAALLSGRTAHGLEMLDSGSGPFVVGGTITNRVSRVSSRTTDWTHKPVV